MYSVIETEWTETDTYHLPWQLLYEFIYINMHADVDQDIGTRSMFLIA